MGSDSKCLRHALSMGTLVWKVSQILSSLFGNIPSIIWTTLGCIITSWVLVKDVLWSNGPQTVVWGLVKHFFSSRLSDKCGFLCNQWWLIPLTYLHIYKLCSCMWKENYWNGNHYTLCVHVMFLLQLHAIFNTKVHNLECLVVLLETFYLNLHMIWQKNSHY